MNQKFIKTYFFLFVCLFFIILVCVYHTSEQPSRDIAAPYILGESDGKLAVYEQGRNEPAETFDTDINIFPDDDIKKLKEGIPAYTKEELSGLIEDFSG